MNFLCQHEAIEALEHLSSSNRHSLLIEGVLGCGKSYLASQYAHMLNISDIQFVNPTVQAVKDALDACMRLTSPMVLVIENLDTGVLAASYALLKFLEEPNDNAYIIVTYRNINYVPDTIISRCACINVPPPIPSDMVEYAKVRCRQTSNTTILNSELLHSVKSFSDIDNLLHLSAKQLSYIDQLANIDYNDSISNIVWKLGHTDDNSEIPISLVLQHIAASTKSSVIKNAAIMCIKDLNTSRLGTHSVLSRFVLECKYCQGG